MRQPDRRRPTGIVARKRPARRIRRSAFASLPFPKRCVGYFDAPAEGPSVRRGVTPRVCGVRHPAPSVSADPPQRLLYARARIAIRERSLLYSFLSLVRARPDCKLFRHATRADARTRLVTRDRRLPALAKRGWRVITDFPTAGFRFASNRERWSSVPRKPCISSGRSLGSPRICHCFRRRRRSPRRLLRPQSSRWAT